MANRIDNCVDAIQTKLTTDLVKADGTGVLKAVKRAVISPFTEPNPPVLGLVVSRLSRESTTWTAQVLLMLAANAGGMTCDERVTDLIARTDDKIVELIDAGSAGGCIDRPVWDAWYGLAQRGQPLQHVGALGTLRIRVEDPLLIED